MIKRDVKKGLATCIGGGMALQCVLKDRLFFDGTSVVNHPDYVAKINDDNKFIQKFGALAEHLIKEKVVKNLYS